MALSKSNRIIVLLAIDSAFFLLELIVGYAVHSLALVADSFHMLNDVLSLCVGLWAVRVANTNENSKMYTYGWQRAETLGALVNGVFLVALCLSIFLEAIQRFVEPQIVSNPKLVLIVGCFGLASNLLGLVLFHDHGHSHGDAEEHRHEHEHDPLSTAEEGHRHSHPHADAETALVGDESGNIADVLPQASIAGYHSKHGAKVCGEERKILDEDNTLASGRTSPILPRKSIASIGGHRRRTSGSFIDSPYVHPATFRQDIARQASRLEEAPESEPDEDVILDDGSPAPPTENSPLMKHARGSPKEHHRSHSHASHKPRDHRHDSWHAGHNHSKPKERGPSKGHGHNHGDLNMRGVFLHVMGDALGNVGVIGSALFIWLASFSWRYYVDPGISLVITCIILTSAIPLCKAASRILLQAVPTGMSIDDIKADIQELPRVLSAHHLHVWQLSGTKLVASLHVQVDCQVEGAGSASYMHLARQIRKCLHGHGIHSSTIQPEFCLQVGDGSSGSGSKTVVADSSHSSSPKFNADSKNGPEGHVHDGDSCLLDCGDDCGDHNRCCPPGKTAPQT